MEITAITKGTVIIPAGTTNLEALVAANQVKGILFLIDRVNNRVYDLNSKSQLIGRNLQTGDVTSAWDSTGRRMHEKAVDVSDPIQKAGASAVKRFVSDSGLRDRKSVV